MKKVLLFVLCVTMSIVAQGSFMCKEKSDDPIIIPLSGDEIPLPDVDGRPRTSTGFYAAIDTDLNLFLISATSDCGDVVLTLENLSTGAYYSTSFDYYHPLSIPLLSTSGWWRVTLTLDNGNIFYGEVEI